MQKTTVRTAEGKKVKNHKMLEWMGIARRAAREGREEKEGRLANCTNQHQQQQQQNKRNTHKNLYAHWAKGNGNDAAQKVPLPPPHKPAPAQGQPRDTAATDVAPSPAPFPCHCPSVGVEIEKTKTNLSMKHFFHSFSAAGSKIKWKLFFIYEKNVRHDTPYCHTRLPYGLGNCVGQHLKWSQRAREPTNHLQFAIRNSHLHLHLINVH